MKSRFRILRQIATGGLSEIHEAHDSRLNRVVALKQTHKKRANDSAAQAQLLFEAEITANLEHPGVVPVYDMGRFPKGRSYFTMRLIRGDNLRNAIRWAHQLVEGDERDAAIQRLLDRLVDVCYTISHAHNLGVMHRDLTPRNVMLGRHGETLVVDWGLAKLIDRPPAALDDSLRPPDLKPSMLEDLEATRTGWAVGTPRYMSPEQAAGQHDMVGPATDVFGLGAILYTILTGRSPYDGSDDEEVEDQARRRELLPPRELDPSISECLQEVCLKAMAASPAERFVSPLEMGDGLAQILQEQSLSFASL